MDRPGIQKLFIRTCRDSGFGLSAVNAAIITGNVLKVSPIEVWCAFSGFDLMERIASGSHPAALSNSERTDG